MKRAIRILAAGLVAIAIVPVERAQATTTVERVLEGFYFKSQASDADLFPAAHTAHCQQLPDRRNSDLVASTKLPNCHSVATTECVTAATSTPRSLDTFADRVTCRLALSHQTDTFNTSTCVFLCQGKKKLKMKKTTTGIALTFLVGVTIGTSMSSGPEQVAPSSNGQRVCVNKSTGAMRLASVKRCVRSECAVVFGEPGATGHAGAAYTEGVEEETIPAPIVTIANRA